MRRLALSVMLLCVPFAMAADVEAGRRKSQVCAACHGADGNARLPGVPSLAAQPAMHTFLQLVQFRAKRRGDAQMSPFSEKLSDGDMRDIAAYYAAQAARPSEIQLDQAKAALGARLAQMHFCGSCHMPDMSGQNQIPRLAGQNYEYLVKQLRRLKSGARRDIDGTMASAAQALSEQDIENVSHFLSGLK
jgi:cytochrome c553